LLMANVLRVTQSAICSGYSHPCEWILYLCLGGQEPESWTDWIWLLLKVASELMFHANIISIDHSLECILNTVLFITLVIVCPFYLFTLLSFPTPSFMTVFSIETGEVCFTRSSHYMQRESILASLFDCFWCSTWGTHSLWAHHTTVWWNGVWWVVMSVIQLRVTASACWSRETILVLYMSGKCASHAKDTCICVCKLLNSVCCFGGMWKVMFSNL
jgi:hypothetical protein